MELSILIVNWNSKEFLRKCVASILRETHGLEFEIIVVDAASFDGCAEMLEKEYPAVHFIQARENSGFARLNNLAFEASGGETLLFLNPDTELTGPAINLMHSAIKGLPCAGAVGGRLLNFDGTVQTSCIQAFPTILNQTLSSEALGRMFPRSRLWGRKALFDNSGKPQEVEMISGACLMMRRAVFEAVGRFSTEYFMYADDVDLCYKAKQHGFINYYVGEGVVIHHGGASSQQAGKNFSNLAAVHSMSQFLRKSRGVAYSNVYRLLQCLAAILRLLLLLILSPYWLIRTGAPRWRDSCSKWFAILNWGLGLSGGRESAVPSRKMPPADQVTLS
ncbi:MAG: glycosyltransferase family 2 protein [Verrucomicrobiota bacterium]